MSFYHFYTLQNYNRCLSYQNINELHLIFNNLFFIKNNVKKYIKIINSNFQNLSKNII